MVTRDRVADPGPGHHRGLRGARLEIRSPAERVTADVAVAPLSVGSVSVPTGSARAVLATVSPTMPGSTVPLIVTTSGAAPGPIDPVAHERSGPLIVHGAPATVAAAGRRPAGSASVTVAPVDSDVPSLATVTV